MKDIDMENAQIEIPRTPEFVSTTKAVSDIIGGLPLSREQNDRLIAALVAHVEAAEKSGFRFGLELGLDYGRYEAAHKDSPEFQHNTPHLVN